jgi:Ca2+-transporting ATPase
MVATSESPVKNVAWHTFSTEQAATELAVDPDQGLASEEVQRRLEEYGPNALPTEPSPSVWVVARGQLANPMNVMLLIVGIASFAIGQVATGFVVTALVTFNVVMGSNQELKARASVDALAQLQVPQARVRRAGRVEAIESTQLVPGDVVLLEAGDLVPADGRIISSATVEVHEAALTGESAPVAKDRATLSDAEVGLGDRTNLVFQDTDVTRGTATFVVTATGERTEMGPYRRHGHGHQAITLALATRTGRRDQGVRSAGLGCSGHHCHGTLTHHHLTEVWTLDDEVPGSTASGDDLTESAA